MNRWSELPQADAAPSFRTKDGRCVVSPERLVLERRFRGLTAILMAGRPRTTVRWLRLALATAMAYTTFTGWRSGDLRGAASWAFITLIIVVNILRSWDMSLAREIERSATTRLEAIRGWRGLTRDRVVAHFSDGGQPARRFIHMPGALQAGSDELERAVITLRAAGWPVVEG